MKSKLLMFLPLALAFASCQERMSNNIPEVRSVIWAASGEASSKTALNEAGDLIWCDGDEVMVNGIRYEVIEGGSTRAQLASKGASVQSGEALSALYPASLLKDGTSMLPSEIEYNPDSPLHGFAMQGKAKSSSDTLRFKNLVGALAVRVDDRYFDEIASIKVSVADSVISGVFDIQDDVAVMAKNGSNTVTMTCDPAVPTTKEGIVFYIPIPQGEYYNLTIKVDSGYYQVAMSTPEWLPITIERNCIYNLDFRVKPD